MNAVTFEMSPNKRIFSRSVFSFLDYLAELGGLFASLSSIVAFILLIFNYLSSYQFVMSELFAERVELRELKSNERPDSSDHLFTHEINPYNNV